MLVCRTKSRLACIREQQPLVPAVEQTVDFLPFVVYVVAVLVVVGGMLGISAVLGQKHSERATGEPYESGIVSTGSARVRLSVRFYLVAMLFVIFDLEVVFIIGWAIALREVGWAGYIGVVLFIGILVAALVYEWRTGALDWGSKPRRR